MNPSPVHGLAALRHDLRTPINHILGYCELLLEEAAAPDGGALAADLRRVEQGARQVLALVNYYFAAARAPLTDVLRRHVQHEIRTPINHIIGYADILCETPEAAGQPAALRDLGRIREAAFELLAKLEQALLTEAPVSVPADAPAARPRPALPPGDAEPEDFHGVRVLVVDDHPESRELLVRQLTRHGCVVDAADGGAAALERLRDRPCDLALLDLVMPDMDGLELLAHLKADERLRTLPVLMLSALDDTETVIHAVKLGADDFLPKPCSTRLLLARLEAALARKRLRELRRRGARFYAHDGTLSSDAPSYVERRADGELLRALLQGEPCYVLTSRQMGKSSLMVRTAERLRGEGVVVALLDLSAGGQNLTAEQWYDGLAVKLGRQLRLEDEFEDYWAAHRRLSPVQRFFGALRELVLLRAGRPCVLFVDELDAVKSLPFSADEFFAALRGAHVGRAEDPAFAGFTVCLLGVAPPTELLRDPAATPYNVGRRLDLVDFTPREARPLAAGLNRPVAEARTMLDRVIHWTSGHPYLTQLLCSSIAEDATVHGAAGVDRLCERLLFRPASREENDNLAFVRRLLLGDPARRAEALRAYERVRRSRAGVPEDELEGVTPLLRQAGLIRFEGGRARVRNRIYARAFDPRWVRASLRA
ncbi:MAG: response regulator [Limisphaerales bacterium]